MAVRERLEALIRERGVSQVRLARLMGEGENWINNRVRGVTPIKADEIPRFAAALGVSPCAFFEEVKPAPQVVRLDSESIQQVAQAVEERIRQVLSEEPRGRRRWTDEEIERLMEHLMDEQLREILDQLPADQRELVRQIAQRRRELRERDIPPEE